MAQLFPRRINTIAKLSIVGGLGLAALAVVVGVAVSLAHEQKVTLDKAPKGTGEAEFTKDFPLEKDDLSSTGRNPYFVLEPGFYVVLENGDERLTVNLARHGNLSSAPGIG